MKMKKTSDQELLREYVRESMLYEYDGYAPGEAGRALRGVVGGAISRSKEDFKGVLGKAKKLGASVKHLAKSTIASLGQVLSLGAFEANLDKIHAKYLSDIKEINREYGPYVEKLNKRFGDNVSPLFVASIFFNPAFAVKALAIKKGAEKASEMALKSALKAGASDKFKDVVDNYFESLKGNFEKINSAKSPESLGIKEDDLKSAIQDYDSQKGPVLDEIKKRNKQVVIENLKKEKERLKGLNADASVLKSYDMLLGELRKT